MIELSRSLSVDDGAGPQLTVEDVWDGLVEKATNPLPYVHSITACTVRERFRDGLVRDIVVLGQPVREVVTFYPKQRVHYVRTHGFARGTVDNEITVDDAGQPVLTFTFRIVVDGVMTGSAEEERLAEGMQQDYLAAVGTTLAAVRQRVATGDPFRDPVSAPVVVSDFTTRLFTTVDAGDTAAFGALFADGARMTFGNGTPMVGRAAIVAGVDQFFTTIKGLHHRVVNEWVTGSDTVVELEVTYDRLDGTSTSIPVVSIWQTGEGGLIDDYRVFFDLAPVFAPAVRRHELQNS